MLLILTVAIVWLVVVLGLIALVWPLQGQGLLPERVVDRRRAINFNAPVRLGDRTASRQLN
jgi:hypothetical protein